VPVDARIQRGRTYHHALRQTLEQERFEQIVITAPAKGTSGFDADDVAWLLNSADGEIVVLRPSKEQQVDPPGSGTVARSRRFRGRRAAPSAATSDDGRAGSSTSEPRERVGAPTHAQSPERSFRRAPSLW
jgi:hypothetical protein